MLRSRPLRGAALLALCLLPAQLVVGTQFRFTSPGEGELLVGTVEFTFSVDEGEPPLEQIDIYLQGQLIGSALPPTWSLLWDAPAEALGATVIAVGYAGGAVVSKARLETRQLSFGEEINVVMVQLYPVVLDRRGSYVGGLGKDDFLVLDQGKPITIESFSASAASLSIVILLDVSNSMVDRLALVQDASVTFIDQLDASDQVGLYAFNHAVLPIVPLTQDHAKVKEGVRTLRASGSTAMHDALLRVLDEIEGVPGRRAVFLFSDGLDQRSIASLEQVIATARKSEAIVYSVGAGKDSDARSARKDLRTLAEETGGEAHFIDRLRELPRVFDAVLMHLRSQYAIGYSPPPGPAGLRTVEVRVSGARYEVRCRRSYYHQDRR